MRRCAAKTLLTHSRRIDWVLLTFVKRLLNFLKRKTWHLWVVAHVLALSCRHGTTENDLVLSQKCLLWSDIAAVLCPDKYCLSETNKRCSFVCQCIQCYCAPGSGAMYRDQPVCLFVRSHISKTTCSNFMQFSVHVACCRRLIFLWRQCNTLCTSAFMPVNQWRLKS